MSSGFAFMKRLLFFFLIIFSNNIFSQPFPSKPVKIIVAFPAGGGTDIVARIVGQKLSEGWGQPVVIDNRAGASGTIGTAAAARAEPDGYTLFMATMGNMVANQHLYPKMAVDPLRALAPVTKVVDVHFVMLAHPSFEANSVVEVIAAAKKRPGEIAYSSSGPGGAPHLAMELFKRQANVNLVHIPYKGSAPSLTATRCSWRRWATWSPTSTFTRRWPSIRCARSRRSPRSSTSTSSCSPIRLSKPTMSPR